MPDPTYITLTPMSGTGSTSLTASANPYGGRESRSVTYSARCVDDYTIVSANRLTVTQLGEPYISTSNPNIGASDTTATATGEANLQKLKVTGSLAQYLTSASVDGVSTQAVVTALKSSAGYTIPNDPGASDRYDISLGFTGIPANATTSPVTYQCVVGDGTNSYTLTVTQAAAEPADVDIWFSDGQSSTVSTTDITVYLDSDGEIASGGASSPYINTIPAGTAWTIIVQ